MHTWVYVTSLVLGAFSVFVVFFAIRGILRKRNEKNKHLVAFFLSCILGVVTVYGMWELGAFKPPKLVREDGNFIEDYENIPHLDAPPEGWVATVSFFWWVCGVGAASLALMKGHPPD